MLCPGGTPLYGLYGVGGMSRWRGCGSKSVLKSFHVLSPKQGIKLEGFDLNRVRVSNSA